MMPQDSQRTVFIRETYYYIKLPKQSDNFTLIITSPMVTALAVILLTFNKIKLTLA